jgi:transcription-repair coupling factor (superfamily II helicase)
LTTELTLWRVAKIQVEGKTQEAIKLVYADNDIVYVSIHSLHKISKYNGKDGHSQNLQIGFECLEDFKQNQGTSQTYCIQFDSVLPKEDSKKVQFAPDSYLQNELESSFIYEDTPDQTKSTAEVKADMERPTDGSLVCDVGFVKQKLLFVRLSKQCDNSKQVAILVPTTILAYQHYRTLQND